MDLRQIATACKEQRQLLKHLSQSSSPTQLLQAVREAERLADRLELELALAVDQHENVKGDLEVGRVGVAYVLGVTHERVRQIEAQALTKCRALFQQRDVDVSISKEFRGF